MNATTDSFLEDLRIAKPCSADWSQMTGDDRARFCGSCQKNVYDLRAMTRQEAEALLRSKGEACVRMTRRADGTVITGDCPVGVTRAAKRQRVAAVVGGGLLAASALLWKVRAGADEPAKRTLLADVEDDERPARKPRTTPTAAPAQPVTGAKAAPRNDGIAAWLEGLAAKLLASQPEPEPEPEPRTVMGEIEAVPSPPPPPVQPVPAVVMGKVSAPNHAPTTK